MKTLFAFFMIITATAAQASYLESCAFKAEVTQYAHYADFTQSTKDSDVKHVLVVKVVSAEDHGSHLPAACDKHVDELKVVSLPKTSIVKVGDTIELSYFFVSGFGPGGVTSNTSYTLVQPKK